MNISVIHGRVADGLQRALETVVLRDWRMLSENQLLQAVARLRTIKASYLNHQMHPDHLEQPALASLDEALLALYLALDTIESRDVAKQRDISRALLDVQYPLLRARASLPLPLETAQDGEDDAPSSQHTETFAASAPPHPGPTIQPEEGHEEHGKQKDDKEAHKQIRWSQGRLLQLQEAMHESRQPSTHAMIKDIASHSGWPVKAVEYKAYALRQQHHGTQEHAPEQAASETAKEDDRRGQSADGTDGVPGRSREDA
jgi:hypothetical protein